MYYLSFFELMVFESLLVRHVKFWYVTHLLPYYTVSSDPVKTMLENVESFNSLPTECHLLITLAKLSSMI